MLFFFFRDSFRLLDSRNTLLLRLVVGCLLFCSDRFIRQFLLRNTLLFRRFFRRFLRFLLLCLLLRCFSLLMSSLSDRLGLSYVFLSFFLSLFLSNLLCLLPDSLLLHLCLCSRLLVDFIRILGIVGLLFIVIQVSRVFGIVCGRICNSLRARTHVQEARAGTRNLFSAFCHVVVVAKAKANQLPDCCGLCLLFNVTHKPSCSCSGFRKKFQVFLSGL